MIYHTVYENWNEESQMTSGEKGIDDIVAGMEACGIRRISIPSRRSRRKIGLWERLRLQFALSALWKRQCRPLGRGDTLIIDLPLCEKFMLFRRLIRSLKRRGVRIVFFAADLELTRNITYHGIKRRFIVGDERFCLREADLLLAHNDAYRRVLEENGASCEIFTFSLFDYLVAPKTEAALAACHRDRQGAVVIATNLVPEKAGYAYELPENYTFSLYGPHYRGDAESIGRSAQYRGAFSPDELPEKLEGGYGLLWDGPSAESCLGEYGAYMRINTPHRISLYLACGLPVIVWEEAYMAKFVREEGCGFTVKRLDEIRAKVDALSEEDYEEMQRRAAALGARIRAGEYTRSVLKKAFGEEIHV